MPARRNDDPPTTSSVADRGRLGRGVGTRRLARSREPGKDVRPHRHLDGRALADPARAREHRPDAISAGAHAGEAEMSVRDARRIEALAVVLDAQSDAAGRLAADVDADLAGRRVLDDVVQRFLGDPIEDLLGRQRRAPVEVALDDDRQPQPALEGGGVGLERRAPAPPVRGCPGAARRSARASRQGPRAGALATGRAARGRRRCRGRAASRSSARPASSRTAPG